MGHRTCGYLKYSYRFCGGLSTGAPLNKRSALIGCSRYCKVKSRWGGECIFEMARGRMGLSYYNTIDKRCCSCRFPPGFHKLNSRDCGLLSVSSRALAYSAIGDWTLGSWGVFGRGRRLDFLVFPLSGFVWSWNDIDLHASCGCFCACS